MICGAQRCGAAVIDRDSGRAESRLQNRPDLDRRGVASAATACWAAVRCGFTGATNLCFDISRAFQAFQVAIIEPCLPCVKRFFSHLDQITPARIDTCAHPQPFAVNQPLQDTQRHVEPAIRFRLCLKDNTEQLFALPLLKDRPTLERKHDDSVIVRHNDPMCVR